MYSIFNLIKNYIFLSLCLCIYLYTYNHMYICIQKCVYIYLCMYFYVHIYTYYIFIYEVYTIYIYLIYKLYMCIHKYIYFYIWHGYMHGCKGSDRWQSHLVPIDHYLDLEVVPLTWFCISILRAFMPTNVSICIMYVNGTHLHQILIVICYGGRECTYYIMYILMLVCISVSNILLWN